MRSDVVFVTGHKNPDSDSICSAIAYADYLFRIGRYNAVPVRLGEVSKETEYILKRFQVETPVLLKTVKQTVEDLDYDRVTVFSKELTLKTGRRTYCKTVRRHGSCGKQRKLGEIAGDPCHNIANQQYKGQNYRKYSLLNGQIRLILFLTVSAFLA